MQHDGNENDNDGMTAVSMRVQFGESMAQLRRE